MYTPDVEEHSADKPESNSIHREQFTSTMLPSLAWEVLERIIDHLQDEVKALRCCALTCRQLRPRARFHLLVHIHIHQPISSRALLNCSMLNLVSVLWSDRPRYPLRTLYLFLFSFCPTSATGSSWAVTSGTGTIDR